MSHTIREKHKLLQRVRRIRGQVEAIERALDQEIGCADVLQLIASVRGERLKLPRGIPLRLKLNSSESH